MVCNLWANPSLGGTTRNHFKEWLRNQKWLNHFPRPFPLIFFNFLNLYYIYLFIFHVYPLHGLILFWIKKIWKLLKFCIPS